MSYKPSLGPLIGLFSSTQDIIAIIKQHLHNSALKKALRSRSQDQINSFGVNKVRIFFSYSEYLLGNFNYINAHLDPLIRRSAVVPKCCYCISQNNKNKLTLIELICRETRSF